MNKDSDKADIADNDANDNHMYCQKYNNELVYTFEIKNNVYTP